MAFKMAKGSLFAILLRSNWWYSVLIGLVVLAAALLITDAKYVVLSISVALPFFAIGGYAAFKQFQQPSQKRVLEVTQQTRKMPAGIIAQKIAANYIKNGYESNAFNGDGADLQLSLGSRKLLLCSKRSKAANTGIAPLKLLVAAGEKTAATGYLYVALGDKSATARDYAEKHHIEFIQASRLAALFEGKAKVN